MALLNTTRMRYSLRVFLVVMAIAPPLLAYFLSPYFQPTPKRTMLVTMGPQINFYTNTPTIVYTVSGGTSRTFSRTSYFDGSPYGSLDYLVADGNKTCKLFFSNTLVGRVHFRPDQAMKAEMDLQFQAIQELMRKRVIRDPAISVEEYLSTHGGRILVELEDDEFPDG